MEEDTVEEQAYGSNKNASRTQPKVKLAQRVSEWTKHFFTLTEEEKDAAGICDYKQDPL